MMVIGNLSMFFQVCPINGLFITQVNVQFFTEINIKIKRLKKLSENSLNGRIHLI